MIDRILEFSLRQRAVVALFAVALLGTGLWSALHLPIDAVPDITGIQVQINTEVPALAAEESEKLVTQPLELELAGLPGVEEMRSITKFGLSQIRWGRSTAKKHIPGIGWLVSRHLQSPAIFGSRSASVGSGRLRSLQVPACKEVPWEGCKKKG